jgi:hypothetical protein
MKKIPGIILAMALCMGLALTPAPAARPTSSPILVNGRRIAFDAYNINDNNYFKLRDLAYVLSGTVKQFEVGWNGATNTITLTSGKPYTPVGGEMAGKGTGNKVAAATISRILLDGSEVSFTAYNIGNNNYFKLRDIGAAFNFGVNWDGESQTIELDTSKGYTPEETAPAPTVADNGLIVADVTVGGSLQDAESTLGEPYRVADGLLQYRFYGDYTRFVMLGARDGIIEYAYANYNIPATGGNHTLYNDGPGGGASYAVSAGRTGMEEPAVTEAIIFETTNAFRAFHGLTAFTWSDTLGAAASAHSEDMAARDYFDHYTPEGKSPGDRITTEGYRWRSYGENIAAGHSVGAETVNGWVNSSGHRGNMLSTSFSEIGVGCAYNSGSAYGNYATQVFGYPQ